MQLFSKQSVSILSGSDWTFAFSGHEETVAFTGPESPPMSSLGHHSIIINGTRFRIGVCGIVALVVSILLLTLLVVVIGTAAVLYFSPVPLIKFDVFGNITGLFNASLGNFGHAEIKPDLDLKLKFVLQWLILIANLLCKQSERRNVSFRC